MTAGQTPAGLWQDYLFLTLEMDKFLAAEDFSMFQDLLNQREKLQTILDTVDTGEFKQSPAGQKLLTAVRTGNQTLMQRLAKLRNQSHKRQQLAGAYDLLNKPVGFKMDRKG